MTPETREANMGATHQSSFEFGFALTRPEAKILERVWKDKSRRSRDQQRSTKSSALQEVLQWQAATPGDSRNFLESIWKSAADHINRAARDVRERSTSRDLLSG